MKYRILMIEGWRTTENTWSWNGSCVLEENVEFPDPTSRKVLKYLRDNNYLTAASKGKVSVTMDGSDIIEVNAKSTDEPLFALEPANVQ